MKFRQASILPLVFAAGAAFAGPDEYVFVPAVSYGEREIDFKYGIATKKDEPSAQAASLGAGAGEYAATVWRIGLMGHTARPDAELLVLAALEEALAHA